jgi:hypothetical protein
VSCPFLKPELQNLGSVQTLSKVQCCFASRLSRWGLALLSQPCEYGWGLVGLDGRQWMEDGEIVLGSVGLSKDDQDQVILGSTAGE